MRKRDAYASRRDRRDACPTADAVRNTVVSSSFERVELTDTLAH